MIIKMIKKILDNDYIFSVFTKMMMIFIAFFHSVVLARFLGTELKGVHATVYSVMTIGAVIINMSSQQAYPFFRKNYGYDKYFDKFMSFTFTYHFIILMIAMILAYFYNSNLIVSMSLILIPLSSLSTVVGYVFLVENPKKRNKVLLIIDIIDVLLLSLFYFNFECNINFVFLSMALPFIMKIIYISYNNKFKFTNSFINKEFFCELIKYSFFPMLSMLLTMLNYKIDIFMLKNYEFITLSSIGIYSIGVSLADKVVYLPDAIKEILLSKLSKGSGATEVSKATRLCFPLSILVTIGVVLFGKPFIKYLYGKEYIEAYMITVICILGTSMMVFFKMISQYNNVNGKQKINVIILLCSVIVNVILNYVLIPKFKIKGAAIASLISYTLCAIIFVMYFTLNTGINIRNMVFPTKDDLLNIKLKLSQSKEK